MVEDLSGELELDLIVVLNPPLWSHCPLFTYMGAGKEVHGMK